MKKNLFIKSIYSILFLLLFFLINFSFGLDLGKLKGLHNKMQNKTSISKNIKNRKNNKNTKKEEKKEEIKQLVPSTKDNEALRIYQNDKLSDEILSLLNSNVKKDLEDYKKYKAMQDAEKNKLEKERLENIKETEQKIKNVKEIIKNNNGIYYGVVYIPKKTPLYYIEYNGLFYVFPYFEYTIEYNEKVTDNSKVLSDKEKILDKLKATVNDETKHIKINDEKEFQKIKENFNLTEYKNFISDLIVNDINNDRIFSLYAGFVVNQALEESGINYKVPEETFVFFIENNDTPIEYKKKYEKSTVKIYSTSLNIMETGISFLSKNSKTIWELKNFKELYIPVKIQKDQKIIVLKEIEIGLVDIILFIVNFVFIGGISFYAIRKLLNLYKNV